MSPYDFDLAPVSSLLRCWLTEQAAPGMAWVEDKCKQIAEGVPERVFFAAFSAVPRHTGKQGLKLTTPDLDAASRARTDWSPGHWSVDQVARTLLVLALPVQEYKSYSAVLDRVFGAADVGEAVTLYQSLPLLPYARHHQARAAEGVRSNMSAVFEAVALRNPYPAESFDELAWNQMVLKALFVGSPLHLILGLDARANQVLALMLVDYAHERWAAGRTVPAELWRPVGPFAAGTVLDDLERVLADLDPGQRAAAALACAQSPQPRARELLEQHPDLYASIRDGHLSWNGLAGQTASYNRR
ncbi:MAG: EboA family metabolite traffic protein [Gemmatimonadaceae bacterium]|nr:EboA family metabolite traffic protein [Gloeobacterales cyanobacterium ES-bin-141]